MKSKSIVSFLAFMLCLAISQPAHALLSLSGHYASFNGGKTGYGAEFSLPLLPLTIGATYIEHTYTSIPSFGSFSGGNMTGSIIPIYATFKFGIPMVPVFAAVEGGYTLGTASAAGTTLPIPGGAYYSVGAGYSFPIIPAINLWAQVGYSYLVLDLRAAAQQAAGTSAGVSNVDFSGMSYKLGATIGL